MGFWYAMLVSVIGLPSSDSLPKLANLLRQADSPQTVGGRRRTLRSVWLIPGLLSVSND
jgi:hypothetical protein